MPMSTTSVQPSGSNLASEGCEVGCGLQALLGGGQEGEPVADLGGVRLPDGVVAHPEAAHHLLAAELRETLLDGAGQRSERAHGGGLAARSGREAPVELGHEGLVALFEGSEAINEELVGHGGHVDAGLRRFGELAAGLIERFRGRGRDRQVVENRVEGGLGQGVHGLGER